MKLTLVSWCVVVMIFSSGELAFKRRVKSIERSAQAATRDLF